MSQLEINPGPTPALAERQRGNISLLRFFDRVAAGGAVGGAWAMVLLLALLLVVVTRGGWQAIHQFGFSFLWSDGWDPVEHVRRNGTVVPAHFGGWPAIWGTLRTALIAMSISVPLSLGCGVFLVKLAPKVRIPIPKGGGRYAWVSPRWFVAVAGFLIELLAAIPSIAYGLWAQQSLLPFLQNHVQPSFSSAMSHVPLLGSLFENTGSGQNIMTAGVVLAIMVTPIITAIIRDVLTVAPPELEQGALGLGATWWQATRLILGVCKLGIIGAVILGFARALGETMAVTLVIGGDSSNVHHSLFDQGQTIASMLALQFNSATSNLHSSALYYAAFVLLLMTTVINTAARMMVMGVARQIRRK